MLGAGVRLARGTLIDARGTGVSIGDGVVSGTGVTVLAVNEIARSTSTGSATQTDAMTIGSRAWLGAHCLITAGAQVGAGAVVAAEALVIDDVPDRAIVSGTPARVVGRRGADDALEFFPTSVEARDTTRGRLRKPATP
ncbi:MAG: acyltransferase [Opitutaceae bacterium]|nr:acyltransferase [Opitutaceae bacterium]